ncbi:MAG: thioredoxin family protein [Bacteroidota bacterium]
MTTVNLKTNDLMPSFGKLPATDGKKYSSGDFNEKKILIVVFSCNHCPYVQAYEDRMIGIQTGYSSKGLQLIAINSNEIKNYPEDSFEKMVDRAGKKKFNFVYLRDDDQSVANAYGATHTPEFFVFDEKRKLRYRGKMDDNWERPESVKENYLRDAIDALLAGKDEIVPETHSIGCTIKWG